MLAPDIETLVPPQNLEAERSLLGACLIEPQAIGKVAPLVSTADVFYRTAHQRIWEAMQALSWRGEQVDLITLSNELERRGTFHDVGGTEYLLELLDVVPAAANVKHYAEIVLDRAVRRAGILAARQACEDFALLDRDRDAQECLTGAIAALQRIRFHRRTGQAEHVSNLLQQILLRHDIPAEERMQYVLRTGLSGLDRVLGLMRPGYLVTLSGRPGEGKTTLTELICRGVAQHSGPVLLWSGECPREVMAERLLAMEALVRAKLIREAPADVFRAALPQMAGAVARLEGLPLWLVDERLKPTVANIEATARVVAEEEGRPLALVALDRIELLAGCDHEDLNVVVHRKAGAVKQMAMSLGCVALLLAQPNENRARDKRDRPVLGDLQYGSALRQNSQAILFLERDDYQRPADKAPTGTGRVWVLKCNDGPSGGAVDLYFREELPAFFSDQDEYLVRSSNGAPVTPAAVPQPCVYETEEIPF